MTRPPILPRPCPLCGIAMQASKSREDLLKFDVFQCLTCHTTIRETIATGVESSGRRPDRPR